MSIRFSAGAVAALAVVGEAGAQVPILMYHAHQNMSFSRPVFEGHMDMLVSRGFTTIDLDRFLAWHRDARPLPHRPIVITFDDNYIMGYTDVYPVLAARGMVGINYTHTRGIGIGAPKASWEQIREMEAAGVFLVESHSRTHPRLSTVSATQLVGEVHGSRDDIAANVNGKVSRHLCYPYGDYSQAVITEAIAAGYLTATTTTAGFNTRQTPLFELLRFSGDGRTVAQLEASLEVSRFLNPPTPGTGWVVDDEGPHASFDGAVWGTSTAPSGFVGSRQRVRPVGAGPEPFRWAVELPVEGAVVVRVRYTAASDRSPGATYTIITPDGPQTATLDQRSGGGAWQTLGTFEIGPDKVASVELDAASGSLSADGVWFELAPVSHPEGWLLF